MQAMRGKQHEHKERDTGLLFANSGQQACAVSTTCRIATYRQVKGIK